MVSGMWRGGQGAPATRTENMGGPRWAARVGGKRPLMNLNAFNRVVRAGGVCGSGWRRLMGKGGPINTCNDKDNFKVGSRH